MGPDLRQQMGPEDQRDESEARRLLALRARPGVPESAPARTPHLHATLPPAGPDVRRRRAESRVPEWAKPGGATELAAATDRSCSRLPALPAPDRLDMPATHRDEPRAAAG